MRRLTIRRFRGFLLVVHVLKLIFPPALLLPRYAGRLPLAHRQPGLLHGRISPRLKPLHRGLVARPMLVHVARRLVESFSSPPQPVALFTDPRERGALRRLRPRLFRRGSSVLALAPRPLVEYPRIRGKVEDVLSRADSGLGGALLAVHG